VTAPPEVQQKLRAEVAALFATRTQAEWIEHFAAHDVCCEPVLTLAEALEHPQHQERAMTAEIADPARGTLRQLRLPIAPAVDRPSPGFGEHTRAFLLEAGFTEEELQQLVAAGGTVLPQGGG
jgi:crotonobetainyl-CoA:carnitine CoA-transferase CaiB-like acyl-CoA transferase